MVRVEMFRNSTLWIFSVAADLIHYPENVVNFKGGKKCKSGTSISR